MFKNLDLRLTHLVYSKKILIFSFFFGRGGGAFVFYLPISWTGGFSRFPFIFKHFSSCMLACDCSNSFRNGEAEKNRGVNWYFHNIRCRHSRVFSFFRWVCHFLHKNCGQIYFYAFVELFLIRSLCFHRHVFLNICIFLQCIVKKSQGKLFCICLLLNYYLYFFKDPIISMVVLDLVVNIWMLFR